MKANAQRGASAKRRLAVAFVLIGACVVWRGGALPVTAGARSEEVADLTADAPVDAARDAAASLPAPVNVERLPGVRNRPRRQPPRLLSAPEVEAGLVVRLERMQEKQSARSLSKSDAGRAFRTDDGIEPPFDRDPPRQPGPPPPAEGFAQERQP